MPDVLAPAAAYRAPRHGRHPAAHVRYLHILRPATTPNPRHMALCNAPLWPTPQARTMILTPMPAAPPDGLAWCACCVGRLAEQLGHLADIAAALAAKETARV